MLLISLLMLDFETIKDYPLKKCKNFGYTFSLVFLIISLYFFFKKENIGYIFFSISVIFFLLTFLFPSCFKLFAILWEKFGVLLGKLFSPIILVVVYAVTILPINLILRVFSVDLLEKKINNKTKSYWIKRVDEKINFRNQF